VIVIAGIGWFPNVSEVGYCEDYGYFALSQTEVLETILFLDSPSFESGDHDCWAIGVSFSGVLWRVFSIRVGHYCPIIIERKTVYP